MKISAINSNYQTKKSLKKNQNNTNMTTPSFEGANKLNKVSAKKLALALMAGIAVTTPSLQSCTTLDNIVNEFSVQDNTDKNDYYINPKVTEKYSEANINRKNFDLFEEKWIQEKRVNILSANSDSDLYVFGNSLDAQLLNYYSQNPDEKNLPSEEKVQGFIDNYNQNKKSYREEATFEQAQEIFNLYKEISKKYNITEQEAVWNCPSNDRNFYQTFLGFSENRYYKLYNHFMEPTPENRSTIQNYMISYDGIKDDDTEKRVVEDMNTYLPEVIDEIHERKINTLIHKKINWTSSDRTSNCINPEEHKNFDLFEEKFVNKTQDRIFENDNLLKDINRFVDKQLPDFDIENLNKIENKIFGYNGSSSSALYNLSNSLDSQLLNYYVQNSEEKNLPDNETIQQFVDNYNENRKSNQEEANLEHAQKILKQYKTISQKYNVTEQEAVWNLPSKERELYQDKIKYSQKTYYDENEYFMNPTSENRKEIQDYIISYDGNKYDDTQKMSIEDIKGYSPEVIDEIHKREINTLIHNEMISSYSQGSDYNKYIGTEETKIAKAKEKELRQLEEADNAASKKAKEIATQKALEAALALASSNALAKAKAEAPQEAYKYAEKIASQKADEEAEMKSIAKAREEATVIAESSGKITTITAEYTATVTYTTQYEHSVTEQATQTASATVTTEKINNNPTKNITETVSVTETATESYTAEATATATSTYEATATVIPKVIEERIKKLEILQSDEERNVYELERKHAETMQKLESYDENTSKTLVKITTANAILETLNIELAKQNLQRVTNELMAIKPSGSGTTPTKISTSPFSYDTEDIFKPYGQNQNNSKTNANTELSSKSDALAKAKADAQAKAKAEAQAKARKAETRIKGEIRSYENDIDRCQRDIKKYEEYMNDAKRNYNHCASSASRSAYLVTANQYKSMINDKRREISRYKAEIAKLQRELQNIK